MDKIAHPYSAKPGGNDGSRDNPAAIEQNSSGELEQIGVLIAEIQKNSRERLRITVGTYKGHEYIGVRVWYVSTDGQYRPSRSGVTVKPSLLPQLIQALGLAAHAADASGAR